MVTCTMCGRDYRHCHHGRAAQSQNGARMMFEEGTIYEATDGAVFKYLGTDNCHGQISLKFKSLKTGICWHPQFKQAKDRFFPEPSPERSKDDE